MPIYESATKLASNIRDSKEYRDFKKSMDEIKKDKESEDLLKNYKFIQLQMKSYENKDERLYQRSKEIYKSMNKKVIKNKKVSRYLINEEKFNIMMNNINKIIADAIKDDYK